MTIVIPIFLAILSIMFGLLSRGNTSMSNHALAGVIVACSALLINIAVGGFSFFIVFSNSDAKQQYWTMVNDTYEQMTGLTFDEILNEYGIKLPESLHD
jgi:membrane-bound ClpP family serine protease